VEALSERLADVSEGLDDAMQRLQLKSEGTGATGGSGQVVKIKHAIRTLADDTKELCMRIGLLGSALLARHQAHNTAMAADRRAARRVSDRLFGPSPLPLSLFFLPFHPLSPTWHPCI
jgi:hypothetical protein